MNNGSNRATGTTHLRLQVMLKQYVQEYELRERERAREREREREREMTKQKLDAFSGFLYSYHLTKGEGLLLETKWEGLMIICVDLQVVPEWIISHKRHYTYTLK